MHFKTRFTLLTFLMLLPILCAAQTSHTTTPANYSTVDKLSLVTFSFDETEVSDMYQAEAFKGQKWAVRNEKGDSVAGAYIYGYELPTAILKIQPSVYAKGTYTINLPEGYLWLYDVSDVKTLAPEETLIFTVSGNQKAPEVKTTFSPSPSEPQGYISKIDLRAEGYIAYGTDVNNKQTITVTDATGAVVANGQAESSFTDSCAYIAFDRILATAGTYTIHIPDNIFRIATDWIAYYSGDYEMLPATEVTYTVSGSDVTLFDVSGGGTSSVPALRLTFPQHKTVSVNPKKDYLCYTIYTSDGHYGSFTATWYDLITTKDNVLTLKLYSPQTTPDTYRFTIPEGDLVFDDGTYNTPLAITFKVTEPKETHVVCSPDNNSTVNELYAMDVTFKDATFVSEVYDFAYYHVTDSLGNNVKEADGKELYFDVDAIKGNTVSLKLSNGDDYTTLTAPGLYHVTLPRSYFFINEDSTEVSSEIVLSFRIVEGEDTHTYTTWGYYDNNDISALGALGGEGIDTYHVAIFIPGNGMLHNARLAGAKVPVRDYYPITSLKVWVANSLSSNMTYLGTADIKNPHNGYNSVRFDKIFAVPSEGCYLGYDICVDNTTPLGTAYPVVYDDSVKIANSLWMSVPGYGWYDYGTQYGVSALQGLFQDLDLSEASAYFGSIEGGMTQTGTTSDWKFPVTTNSESAVRQIDYQITVNGNTDKRTAIVNIPAGKKQQSTMNVSITSPENTGTYDVKLSVLKINGKDNALTTTSVSTFSNVMRTVTRRTVVEEITGTGCGWCPRGLIGLRKLNEAYGDSVICLAFHRYNTSDPMWCNYASTDELYMDSAPKCAIDRKTFADPYAGNGGSESTGNGIIKEVANYAAIPAAADITMKAAWTTTDCREVKIDATLAAFTDDTYRLVYVVTADDLFAESQKWTQSNYYYERSANDYPEDLALFCNGGEYGTSTFKWRYDDVVIGSSYNENGVNTSTDVWTMKGGDSHNGTFTVSIPQEGVIAEAIKGSIDKVYAVVFALDGKGQIVQAAKVNVSEVAPTGITEVQNSKFKIQNSVTYNLAGQRITAPKKGQIVISGGRKVVY